ncbi:two-component system response regulator [Thermotomaculum hydrothermale]|uniref:Two-component system response regulator n=1 Tax=Thermotomaculum hydrothermale TaxID=981385 RepID=A0A7R6PRA0_9BACT|nr:response regulator [Thermotomaculum hydrothermale]BBB32891.1 two-component system response regulator [Thermotomaculum hydrothermale]
MNPVLKVLLIEDNKRDIVLFKKALQETKLDKEISLIILTNGKDAVDYISGKDKFSDRDKFSIPDLIVLDLTLPLVHGFDVLKTIKSNKETETIPVTIFSVSNLKEDIEQSLKLGADRYEIKPLSFKGFTEKIKEIIDSFKNLKINREKNNEWE